MLNISVNLQDTKNLDHIFKSSLDFQSFFNGLYVIYQLSETKDDIHVVSQCTSVRPLKLYKYVSIKIFKIFLSPRVIQAI